MVGWKVRSPEGTAGSVWPALGGRLLVPLGRMSVESYLNIFFFSVGYTKKVNPAQNHTGSHTVSRTLLNIQEATLVISKHQLTNEHKGYIHTRWVVESKTPIPLVMPRA